MGARNVRDLRCWRRADELRTEVQAICSHPAVERDFRFCDGFRAAAGSVCRNIAEGFGRYGSGHIVQFFTYALASLCEVQDYLQECRTRRILDSARFEKDWDMAEHVRAMCLKFMKPHQARLRNAKTSEARCFWYSVPEAPTSEHGGTT